MMETLDEIKNILRKQEPLLKATYQVSKIGVFGSFARGENDKDSDVDILIEFSHPIGFFKFIKLENYLSEIIGRKVDLVTNNALKSIMRDDVLRDTIYV